jgi:hypothetical protein
VALLVAAVTAPNHPGYLQLLLLLLVLLLSEISRPIPFLKSNESRTMPHPRWRYKQRAEIGSNELSSRAFRDTRRKKHDKWKSVNSRGQCNSTMFGLLQSHILDHQLLTSRQRKGIVNNFKNRKATAQTYLNKHFGIESHY